MDPNNSLTTNSNDCQRDLTISGDWWFDLLHTSEYGSWSSTPPTNHDGFPIDCAATHASFDSPTSSSGCLESPMSYTNLTNSSPVPFQYNVIEQQRAHYASQGILTASTQVKTEVIQTRSLFQNNTDGIQRRRNQNRVAQRAYRDRKEQRLRELEDELAQCKRGYEQLLQCFRSQQTEKEALQAQTTRLDTCKKCMAGIAARDRSGGTPPSAGRT